MRDPYELLSATEAAKELKIDPMTFREVLAQGTFPFSVSHRFRKSMEHTGTGICKSIKTGRPDNQQFEGQMQISWWTGCRTAESH